YVCGCSNKLTVCFLIASLIGSCSLSLWERAGGEGLASLHLRPHPDPHPRGTGKEDVHTLSSIIRRSTGKRCSQSAACPAISSIGLMNCSYGSVRPRTPT